MTTLKRIDKRGFREDGSDINNTIVKLVQQEGRRFTATVTSLTDNESAVASDGFVTGATPFVGAAVNGTNLAASAGAIAALSAIKHGLAEVMNTAIACLVACGAADAGEFTDHASTGTPTTYATGGTLAAVTPDTGAATGPNVAAANAILAWMNNYDYTAAVLCSKVSTAVGVYAPTLSIKAASATNLFGTTGLIAPFDETAVGAAGTPAVTLVEFNAALTRWETDIKAMVTFLNLATADGVTPILAVRS